MGQGRFKDMHVSMQRTKVSGKDSGKGWTAMVDLQRVSSSVELLGCKLRWRLLELSNKSNLYALSIGGTMKVVHALTDVLACCLTTYFPGSPV